MTTEDEHYYCECYEPKICHFAEEIGINGIAVILAKWAADSGDLRFIQGVVSRITESEVTEYLDYCSDD